MTHPLYNGILKLPFEYKASKLNPFLVKYLSRHPLYLLFCAVLMVSLVYSFFFLSVSIWAFTILAVFSWDWQRFRLGIHDEFVGRFKSFWKTPVFWIPTLLFFVTVLSYFWSDNTHHWLFHIRTKLPFIFIPISLFILYKFPSRDFYRLLWFFVVFMTLTTIPVLLEYFLNFQHYQSLIEQGQSLKTPVNHIRYSMMISLAILCGIEFLRKIKFSRPLIMACTLFLFVFLHILAVRTGLVLCYGGLVIYMFVLVVKTGFKWWHGLALAAIVASPLVLYQLSPSLQTKLRYMLWDQGRQNLEEAANYSDQSRALSWQVGWHLVKTNPVLGVGAGDIRDESRRAYKELFDLDRDMYPHNQFLFMWAAMGIPGLVVMILFFLNPLFFKKYRGSPLLIATLAVFALSCMVENTIQTSVGTALVVFFYFFLLRHLPSE